MIDTMEETIKKLYFDVEQKKSALIKAKLREKGFKKYADEYEFSRFPKVICETGSNGWSLYWADDGSERGCFIVAISPYHIDNTCEVDKVAVSFQWVDKLPLIEKR